MCDSTQLFGAFFPFYEEQTSHSEYLLKQTQHVNKWIIDSFLYFISVYLF